jgi:branched-chain amino acid transport system substrate-binding protein
MQDDNCHTRLRAAMVGLCAVAAMGVGACGDDDDGGGGGAAKSKAPIVVAGLEGEVAEGGPDFMQGMQVAVREINAGGGIEGRKVELKIFKTGGTPEGAAGAYRRAGQDNAVVGSFLGASGALAIRSQSARTGLPIIAASGNDKIDRPVEKWVFQNSAGGEYATSSVVHAVKKLGVKKIGILHYETDFSTGLAPAIEDRCKEIGCEVTVVEAAGAADPVDKVTPQLTKLKNSGADAYYIESLNPAALKAARQLGMFDKPILAEQWLTVPPLAQAAGNDAESVVFGGHKCRAPDIVADDDPLKKWCQDYIAKFEATHPGKPFALFSIYGYDAVHTYAEAARRAIKDGDEVNRDNVLKKMETFNGEGFRTSHGLIKTGPENHRLTGEWGEAYVNMTIEASGKTVKWVLADQADPGGAEA